MQTLKNGWYIAFPAPYDSPSEMEGPFKTREQARNFLSAEVGLKGSKVIQVKNVN